MDLKEKGEKILMPAISKIRFTNAIYDSAEKRYNDEIFEFDGYNGAILLENGGGKTTFIQIAIQAILPHADLGGRKIRDTLLLEGNPCHIAVEWIINESPRRYALTAVTLYLNNGKLDSYKYVYEYGYDDKNSIENIPFTKNTINGNKRPASKEEMGDYYQSMSREYINAKTFPTIKEYHKYIEESFKIIPKEWRRIGIINGEEGGIRKFFENCKTTDNLVDRLLIPVVEEAMDGKGTEDFVDNFEKQREHFKKHKYLKESIDESRQIQGRIGEYVNIYGEYNKEHENLYSKKSYGKALYQYISKEDDDTTLKLQENAEDQVKYQHECRELNRMRRSYELAILKNTLLSSRKKYEEILKNYEIHKEQLNNKETKIQNLKISKINKQIKILEDEILLYQNQLESLERDDEVSAIEKQLNKNSSKINSYFQIQINKLNREIAILENKGGECEGQLKKHKYDKEIANEKYNKLSECYIRNDQEKKTKEKNMENIKKEILSNPETERIEDEYPQWIDRVGNVEKILVEYQMNIKALNDEKDELKLQLENHREELLQFSTEKDTLKEKIKNIEEQEYELLTTIKESIPNLYHVNSIYTKQEQILMTLENKCESIRKEKEDLIINERIFHRFIDDYKDSAYFTAEPLLSKWISEWNDEFSFLESGAKYIERAATNMDKEVEYYYRGYPYWAIAVVVEDNEELKLKNKLERNLDQITYPIVILSQGKAQQILRNGSKAIDDNTCFYPSMWKVNIVRKNFQQRKDELNEKANEVTQNRKDKENELNNYDNILSKIVEFLNKYSLMECLRPLKDELKNVEEKIDDIKEIIDKKDKRIKGIDDRFKSITNDIQELTTEKGVLNKKIEKAMEYIKEKREVSTMQKKIFELKTKVSKINREISKLIESIETVEKKIRDINIMINNTKNLKNNLLIDETYMEVKDSSPLESNTAIEILKKERKDIKDVLDKRQRNRKDIEENIKRTQNSISQYKTDLNNEINSAKFPIEEIEFPLYGEKEIKELIKEIKSLNPVISEIMSKRNMARDKLIKDENNYENKKDDFFNEYENIMEFIEPLEAIKDNMNEKQQELDTRYKYLKSMEEKLNKECSSIKKALDLLVMKNERYEYLSDKVETSLIPKDILVEIPYNRIKYVNLLVEELEEISNNLEEKWDRVSKEKSKFEQFCNNSISDPRLKNMAISGITYKNDFEELTKWKRIMDKNIDSSIKMLEEDLIEHDKEINQFITHLHVYLKTIAEEIRSIPKKTRIKVDDKWKEVYIIDVPTWEDGVGREKLINYINSLLKEIEDIRFKDEDGNENEEYVRNFIENRFQGKELLKIVMGNQKIKVKCRKVTNDGKINSVPVSWGKSNNWSGGETWSKNMTLFLGILNYLAEKSQSIQSSGKRNRTVILDNPFGEASSDHVLDPVFFIAEKLGFQILALTAHSGGKYIRDFFPVVYSCRLRPSKNNETQILTKEKEINYAYLKDNDPNALMRLGDVEQLSLV